MSFDFLSSDPKDERIYSKFVSPAKCLVVEKRVRLFKSLIYTRKSSGPSTDPCGTPCKIGLVSDFELPIVTYCCLFLR
jgi:hypothetical protein